MPKVYLVSSTLSRRKLAGIKEVAPMQLEVHCWFGVGALSHGHPPSWQIPNLTVWWHRSAECMHASIVVDGVSATLYHYLALQTLRMQCVASLRQDSQFQYDTIWYDMMFCCVLLFYIVLGYITLHDSILWYITVHDRHYMTLHCITSYYITLYYAFF